MSAVRPFDVKAVNEVGHMFVSWMSRVASVFQGLENGQLSGGFVRLAGDDHFDGHVPLMAGLWLSM
jgi:hypothetical protein